MSNMPRIMKTMAAAVALSAIGLATPAFAQDAHIGTWKEDFSKSKFSPPPTGPAPISAMRAYEKFGDGLKFTATTVGADGKSGTATWSAHFDGKDYPFIGVPNYDTIALKRINASSFTSEIKKAGKLVLTVRNTVSADGKTMTNNNKGVNAQGQPTTTMTVWDKQ